MKKERTIYIPAGNRFELWGKLGNMLASFEGKTVRITIDDEPEEKQEKLF